MTVTPTDGVNLVIDGVPINVPKGTLVIRAAEMMGIAIPRFCDHPLLDPVGACRQCLVDIGTPRPDGSMGWLPKPQPACVQPVSEGMEVKTQLTSPVAEKAQHGIMEFLLINHPLDCPVCDKGGECPLQNQAMSTGRAVTRFHDVKRTFPKPINVSTQVLLDRERCVLCQRCTRFSAQIAGDPFISLVERGAMSQIGIYEEEPFQSYFSGNTIQICPVGALTSAAYRFRSRPFDLVSTPSICEHCASGCAIRTDHRRGVVLRRLAGDDPAVNEEWNCDKGRWGFHSGTLADRLRTPLVRDRDGGLRPASWSEALAIAAKGLTAANAAGVLTGGRITAEDAYAYAKFARIVLGTNDIDFRARPLSAAEMDFLGQRVATRTPSDTGGTGVAYADLVDASAVLLVGFEPEDESPIVFLTLRKAWRKRKTQVYAVAPFASKGTAKMGGVLLPTAPGAETEVLARLASASGDGADDPEGRAAAALRSGGVILVGERLALVPGALAAAAALADATGAQLAWVPRRAGERGALECGAAPTLLPGGRPVADATARAQVAGVWGVDTLPEQPGRDTAEMIAAAASGQLGALVVGGVDPGDLVIPGALDALRTAFVVALDYRESPVTAVADVVLPVAPHTEKGGTFVNWEGRLRSFGPALISNAMSDHRVVDMVAAEMGEFLGTRTLAEIHGEWVDLGPWTGAAPVASNTAGSAAAATPTGSGDFVLATWAPLLDGGRLLDGEPFLAGTARPLVACLAPDAASRIGVADGDFVTVSSTHGALTAPVRVVPGMVDAVVWLPTSCRDSRAAGTARDLIVAGGARVSVAPAAPAGVTSKDGAA